MSQPYKTHLTYEVSYADTDRMGFVYYANYLVFFERTRSRLLADVGYPYPKLEADGFGLPVIEAHVDYRASATYGDLLDFHGWLDSHTATRLRVACEVRKQGALLAVGYTVHACLNLQSMKPTRLPSRLAETLADPSDSHE